MPNPISRVKVDAGVFLGLSNTMALRPELALLVAETFSTWATLENCLLHIYVRLCGGRGTLAANVFLALDGDGAKKSAIRAAAETQFEGRPDALNCLTALLSIIDTASKERNRLTHWTWGISPDLDDALLLADPRNSVLGLQFEHIMVYPRADFDRIIKANDRLCDLCRSFETVVNSDANIKAFMREPEIKAKIEARAARAAAAANTL